jgi:hypothetical protein
MLGRDEKAVMAGHELTDFFIRRRAQPRERAVLLKLALNWAAPAQRNEAASKTIDDALP